jgi:hypothetical protein
MQNAIIAALQEMPDMAYGGLYHAIFGPAPTESQLASARRAIMALQRKGLVTTRAFAVNHYGRAGGAMSVQLVPHSLEEQAEFAARVEKHRAEARERDRAWLDRAHTPQPPQPAPGPAPKLPRIPQVPGCEPLDPEESARLAAEYETRLAEMRAAVRRELAMQQVPGPNLYAIRKAQNQAAYQKRKAEQRGWH